MTPKSALRLSLGLAAVLLSATAIESNAQEGAKSDGDPVEVFERIPRSQRPKMAVKDFEFQAQVSREDQSELNSLSGAIFVLRGGNPKLTSETNAANLARSTSTLLAARLDSTHQFRMFEREQLATVTSEQDLVASDRAKKGQDVAKTGELLGARYVVTDAITKFGKSKKDKKGLVGAILKGAGAAAGISSSQTDFEVGITVKVIDASTGEIVASATSEGVQTGDTERKLSALGGTWGAVVGGAFSKSATQEREKRVTEAQMRAIDLIVIKLVEARKAGDLEP